ncbi:MAG: heterotetrameric sarcosine oxidase gamma subunit [Planctomycetota bacterium]|jgi:heterotetrameric sarcosine oxidase gamma subunit
MHNSLQISHQTLNGLWSIRANADFDLKRFSESLLNRAIRFGETIANDQLRLIQLWPDAAYLYSQQVELPAIASEYEKMITDISHGFCRIQLTGENALPFLNNYCSADLEQADINSNQCLRTSLGHYSIVIWWGSKSELQLLVDRSYAHSFIDFLNTLALRH